ncbi:putative LL-diaminopimelate aminotransferase [Candidatus Zixiibacteriota bacterium]|nr:putative LL-diaminopimelate aminotransferase [candidate division Zixibacteria bacterium]
MIKKVILDKADRIYHFPFDPEEYFPKRTMAARERGLPIIDLGHFRWPGDIPQAGADMQMASGEELLKLKRILADWLKKECGLKVNPRREIYLGHGIRRIMLDLSLAFVESGDIVLCPEPGLPVYRKNVICAGGVPVSYTLSEKTNYKPSLKKIAARLGKAAHIIILNNPHNPLGSILDETELEELVRMASKENLFIVNDAAYCSLTSDKYVSPLAIPGGDRVAAEVFSIPFAFGLPPMPFGFAVGSSEIISGLETIGRATGNFIPRGWIDLAIKGVENFPSPALKEIRKNVQQSRLAAREVADRLGWKCVSGDGAPFVWLKIPRRRQSSSFAAAMLRRRRILTLPGSAFGESGEGYLRLSLTASADDYRKAGERVTRKNILKKGIREE